MRRTMLVSLWGVGILLFLSEGVMPPTPWYFRTEIMFPAFAFLLWLIAWWVEHWGDLRSRMTGHFAPPHPSHVH